MSSLIQKKHRKDILVIVNVNFTVHYVAKLYRTVQYNNISVIFSSEMSFLAPKTMETTCNMPVVNSFEKKMHFSVHIIVQSCTVRTVHKYKRHFEFRNEFLDPKNHGKDISHAHN